MPMISYSRTLIRFVLINWIDIASGCLNIDKMSEFTKSVGRKNPVESQLIWQADVSKAIASLSNNPLWSDCVRDLSIEGLRFHAPKLPQIQREITKTCIFQDYCYEECLKCPKPIHCRLHATITQMKCYLNGEPYEPERINKKRKVRVY